MDKLVVLHLLNSNKFSGAEHVVVNIIKNMPISVESIYCSPDGPIREKLSSSGVTFESVNAKFLTVKEVKSIILKVKPDIIHAHDFTAGIIASLTCTRIPIINGESVTQNIFLSYEDDIGIK